MVVLLVMQNDVDDMSKNLTTFMDTGLFYCGRYGCDQEVEYVDGEKEFVGVIELETSYFNWILFRIWLFIYHSECRLLQVYRRNDTYIITSNE